MCVCVSHRHEALALPVRREPGPGPLCAREWGGPQHSQTWGRLSPGTEKGPPTPAQLGPPPCVPGPCQEARNAERARGHWPLRRAPRGLLTHPAPAATCLLWITPGLGPPHAPSAGHAPGQQQGVWPGPQSCLQPPAAPRRGPLRTDEVRSYRHQEGDRTCPAVTECSLPPLGPHAAAVLLFVARSSEWQPPVLCESWGECHSSRHEGGGLLWAQGGLSTRPGP